MLDKSIDEIDLEIGRALLADDFGSKPTSDAEARSAARHWFESNLGRLRSSVCPTVHAEFLDDDSKTRNELLAAVIDTLAKVGGWGSVPLASLGARLLHYGLKQLCPTPNGKPSSTA